MARALSVNELMKKTYHLFEFEGEWFAAFDRPERTGTWFIWGNSGNGKTSFVLALVKYLAGFCKVAYNSLEEGGAHSMQQAFARVGMQEVAGRVILIEGETMQELQQRMAKRRSPDAYVIDSLQYAGITYETYKRMKEANRHKLIIFVSHADGKMPEGRSAKKIMFDAGLKIWVEGYRAISKGRYIGEGGGQFIIWPEGSEKYWGEKNKTITEK